MINKDKQGIRTRFPNFMKLLSRIRNRLKLRYTNNGQIFTEYFKNNIWGDEESISGPGSRLDVTSKIRGEIPVLISKLNITSILDIPCGDFNWMRLINLNIRYTGADIVSELIDQNQEKYSNDLRNFIFLDLLNDPLPRTDLILCRDCLVHFSNKDAITAIRNIKASGSTYLLTTSFDEREINRKILTGEWRPINLTRPPFSFPPPLDLLDDSYESENYRDKKLGFWRISDLPDL